MSLEPVRKIDIRKLDQEAAQQQKLNMPKSGFCYRSLRMIKERKNVHCWLLQSEPGQDSDIQFWWKHFLWWCSTGWCNLNVIVWKYIFSTWLRYFIYKLGKVCLQGARSLKVISISQCTMECHGYNINPNHQCTMDHLSIIWAHFELQMILCMVKCQTHPQCTVKRRRFIVYSDLMQ